MTNRLIIASLIIRSMAVCSLASAQNPDAPGDTAELSRILRKADVQSWRVRAVLVDDVIAEGRVQWRGEGIANIGTRRLGLTEIDRLDRRVRAGGGASEGVLIGSAVAAVGLYTLASLMLETGSGAAPTALGVGILVGGSAGALIGGAVRPEEVKWIPLWP